MNTITEREPIRPAGRAGRPMCPVCGRDGCGQTSIMSMCFRVESPWPTRDQRAWLHFKDGAERTISPSRRIYAPPPIAPIDVRNDVYRYVLRSLDLSPHHRDQLRNIRSLSDDTIDANDYRSIPHYAITRELVSEISRDFDLNLMPGFYRTSSEWALRWGARSGIIIPIRDEFGRIQALQVRNDSPGHKHERYKMVSTSGLPQGASSRMPAHYAHPERAEQGIVITEGALKADVIAELMRNPAPCVVGLASVGTFSFQFGWELRQALPNLTRVGLAYDNDRFSNPHVETQHARLRATLDNAGIENSPLNWNRQFKGLDDYLIASSSRGTS